MNLNKKGIVGISLCAALALQALGEEKKQINSLDSVDVIATEDKKSYTVESMKTSTKLNLSIKDTPQSVTVVTKEELEDRNIDSYQKFISNVNGISLERWDERVSAMARGFDVDYYQIDGKPTYQDIFNRDPDLITFDRVEIVKGANGLTNGAGNPAISMNFVRKRADSKKTTGTFKYQNGSWDKQGLSADISSSISDDEKVRGRFIVKQENGNYFLDKYERKNSVLYGVIDADLSDTSKVSFGYSYHNLDRTGIRWGGNPAFYSDGTRADFDLSKNPTEDWTYRYITTRSYFADFEQYIKNDIKLSVSYSHMNITDNNLLLYFSGKVDKTDGSGLSYYTWDAEQEHEDDNLDAYVSIPFSNNGLEHEVVVGYTFNRNDQYKYKYAQTFGSVSNFFNIDIAEPTATPTGAYDTGKTIQKGYYATGKYSLTKDLKLIAGARVSSYEYDQRESQSNASTTNTKFENEITPFVGTVYNVHDDHSLYASYTTIYKAQSEKDVSGNRLDPKEGNSFEVGVKSELFNNKLNTSATLFNIKQDNVAQKLDGVKVAGSSTEDAYTAAEGVTSKGIELSASGEITDRWSLTSGFTKFEAKDKDGNKVETKSSRRNFNLFTKYKFDEFSVGGGLNYKSEFYTGSGTSKITQGGFTIAELMADYQIEKDMKVQLNVANLFDKRYYEAIGNNTMSYGEPRNFTASLKYTF